jgi:hypothetical protein
MKWSEIANFSAGLLRRTAESLLTVLESIPELLQKKISRLGLVFPGFVKNEMLASSNWAQGSFGVLCCLEFLPDAFNSNFTEN